MGAIVLGVTDLATTHPELAAQALFDPTSVTAGSHLKAGWHCSLGHEWVAVVKNRAGLGRGCPYCTNQRVLPGYNDLATTHPQVAAEALFDPTTVVAGSIARHRWRCYLGHEWTAPVYSRASNGVGCPVCAGKAVWPGYNDLATTHPELAAEALFDPATVTAGCAKRLGWRCACGYEWKTQVGNRALAGTGCSRCAQSGFSQEKSAACYLVAGRLDGSALILQYGKTNDPSVRLAKHRRGGFTEVIAVKAFDAGREATEMENCIKAAQKSMGVENCADAGMDFDGKTEAFFLNATSKDFARWLYDQFDVAFPAAA